MDSSRQQRESPDKPKIAPGDICVGCIVWLPKKNDLNGGVKCCCSKCPQPAELEELGYDHPIVILKIRQKNASRVVGDLVTTFSNKPLSKYLKQKAKSRGHKQHFESSVPIFHNTTVETLESHQTKQLKLEEGNLRKQSYVRTMHVYQTDISNLHTYGWVRRSKAYSKRLSAESYVELMKDLGLDAEYYENTQMVPIFAPRRLAQIMASSLPRQPVVRSVQQPQILPQSINDYTPPPIRPVRSVQAPAAVPYNSIFYGTVSHSNHVYSNTSPRQYVPPVSYYPQTRVSSRQSTEWYTSAPDEEESGLVTATRVVVVVAAAALALAVWYFWM